jgi:hypothetical protein
MAGLSLATPLQVRGTVIAGGEVQWEGRAGAQGRPLRVFPGLSNFRMISGRIRVPFLPGASLGNYPADREGVIV